MARVLHFEIPSDDPQRTIRFYERTLGWKIQQYEGQPYWLISTGEHTEPGIDGAIMPRDGPFVNVVNTIGVESLDVTIRRIEENGGTIVVPRTAVPKVGWLIHFKDTEGNLTGAIQPDENAQ